MNETTPTIPGIDMLTESERNYVENVPETDLRAELAKQVRLVRIASNQCQAHEEELDRVLAERNG
jgi:hypothetical protein